MALPTVEVLSEQLAAVSGATEVTPDAPIRHIPGVDSLDLMEWLYNFQNEHPDIPADESLFAELDDTTTMRDVYAKLVDLAPQPAEA
ncbi:MULTISPECIES: hypothetical protein [Streptomyces]|uniref:hypothetical protein n=1 Tax=Streptomyces TaxID=1883 RepID=UPI000D51988F|nr:MULTISPECIES: hypothetical protein [Streptomyces]MXG29015.1 hypothetical protein [Streptomyces sp. YIM 132580]NYS17870.1 hypothetical protein [Streptomyces sp. SJ1-7]PVC77995.1 hypothetical protein DBP15_03970 [Streptomyces sp. CS065A]